MLAVAVVLHVSLGVAEMDEPADVGGVVVAGKRVHSVSVFDPSIVVQQIVRGSDTWEYRVE